MTFSYALLRISRAAYDEIRGKLTKAGYSDQFIGNHEDPSSPRILMQGIALVPEKEERDPELR